MATKRRIIQIQALRFDRMVGEDLPLSQETELIALCNDGSMWTRTAVNSESEWIRVEDIPQD